MVVEKIVTKTQWWKVLDDNIEDIILLYVYYNLKHDYSLDLREEIIDAWIDRHNLDFLAEAFSELLNFYKPEKDEDKEIIIAIKELYDTMYLVEE